MKENDSSIHGCSGETLDNTSAIPEFRGWLEQLDGIYMHYYRQYRRPGRKQAQQLQSRHWQRYDQDR